MKQRYEAVVIGAGPAGLLACRELVKAGFEVLLLEKHDQVGRPLCCAEAVPKASFDRLVAVRPEWIGCLIDKIKIIAPSGNTLDIYHPEAGYVLNRYRFEKGLARELGDNGCDIQLRTIGLELSGDGDAFSTIKILTPEGKTVAVRAAVFIAADGVESKIARLAGVNNLIDINEVESVLQYRLKNVRVATDTIELHIGNKVAPKGYAWVFPKSSDSANVGLGICVKGERGPKCEKLLNAFIRKRFGRAEIVFKSCGLTPKYQGPGMFRKGNLLIAGDAARSLDSLSGAGIVNAMMSGRAAGMAAVRLLSGKIKKDELGHYYPRRFLRLKGEELEGYRRLRKVYANMSDSDFEDVVVILQKYFKKHRSEGIKPARLLTEIIKTRPRLLHLVRYLI